MKSLFRLTTVILALATAVFGQGSGSRIIVLTKDNYAAVHAQLGVRTQPTVAQATVVEQATGFGPNSHAKIGIFFAIMWPSGQAAYEFDWFKDDGKGCGIGPTDPPCDYYSDTISFKDMIINVNGLTFHTGPFAETEGLGIAFFLDSVDEGPKSSCQPLTARGTTPDGFTHYQTSCVDVALQLVLPTNPYTFTMPNGDPVTTYGVNTFIIGPMVGKADLYSHCIDNGFFCGGQTIPVFVPQDLKSEGK